MTLTANHGFWIVLGGLIVAVAVRVGRSITKGKKPQQFGDEVQ